MVVARQSWPAHPATALSVNSHMHALKQLREECANLLRNRAVCEVVDQTVLPRAAYRFVLVQAPTATKAVRVKLLADWGKGENGKQTRRDSMPPMHVLYQLIIDSDVH